jgi:hypothetical protein
MGCISFTSPQPAVTTLNLYQPLQSIQILSNINLAKELKMNHSILIQWREQNTPLCARKSWLSFNLLPCMTSFCS